MSALQPVMLRTSGHPHFAGQAGWASHRPLVTAGKLHFCGEGTGLGSTSNFWQLQRTTEII